jgi:hypothetical protein
MATRMQQRRGTASEWTSANPTLAAGEIGFETDSGQFKIGDGTTSWSSLNYFKDAADLEGDYLTDSMLGAANGVASLDADGQVPLSQLATLIGSAPETLDTLGELAAGIGTLEGLLDDLGTELTTNYTTAITQAISDLTDGYEAGDTLLSTNLTTSFEAADTALSGSLTTAFTGADTALETSITTAYEAAISDAVAEEATQRSAADAQLSQDITDAIALEVDARNNAITSAVDDIDTDDVEEGSTNLYFTESRAQNAVVGLYDSAGSATAAQTAAEATASGYISDHNSETTNVHGIADTSLLATSTDVSNAQSAAQTYADGLAVNYDAVGSATTAQAAAESTAASALSAHESDTTNVHGIADTSDLALLSAAAQTFNGNITIGGNLTVSGETVTVSASDLSVRDNMIYLNQAGLFDLAGAAGDGSNVVYTTSTDHDIKVGDWITVSSANPSSFDISGEGLEVTAVTADTITVASTVTDTYVDGGSLRGKSHANPDLGWAAGRYDGGYAHAGIFRDASDGVFKFFDGYVPEPDESVFIDTAHASFALADLSVADLTANTVSATNGIVFTDGTQTKVGVPSITGFIQKTAGYTLDTLDHQDNIIEMDSASAVTFTIPTDAALAWPVGASMDIFQAGSGQVTIAPADGSVTLNATPGLKLRTQWSSATILKRAANSWVVYGDLTA